MTIEETLKERGSNYGDYGIGSRLRANIMREIKLARIDNNLTNLTELEVVYIYDIVNKLSRLVTTPYHLDTWHDIAGYATLVEKELKKGITHAA